MFKRLCVILTLFVCFISNAQAYILEAVNIGGVDVEVRRAGNATYPLIIFSHGAGACPKQYHTLQSELADAGYVVLAIKHQDCFSGNAKSSVSRRDPEKWTDTTNRFRRDEINAVLDALPKTATAKYIHDLSKIGCMGHSRGGYTCMGMAGAWPSWKRKEISAVAALSPWHRPYTAQKLVGNMADVKLLYQGGTKDKPVTPELTERKGAYDQTNTAKYMQVFKRARHSAWTDARLGRRFHDEMSYYLIAFFDASLKGGDVKKLEKKTSRVNTLEFKH